ncbi:hypothetical protein HXX76_014204 [Chlamydomonas incerta]|uniref:Pherophorin domain-containing protein n=1 Tax=Chlamydomonas incerta TaxID=51695 RepID=A0A835VR80_CHLIN|nr:hypothetical protein HXX76_014204 [Chlamydomonas incerta]|eukprot:KAG2424780.1 hypothetical protein HXX76_014204 [Chlamydomonas incerta]
MKVAVVAAALAALVAVAAAAPPPPPPPGFARFPYGSCDKDSPFRTYEASFPKGQAGNVFCWRMQYQGNRCVSDPDFKACCQNDVHKFSLAFEPSCAPGFKASATLNGVAVSANSVVLETPPNADKRMTLAVKNLGLAGPAVEGAEVCITVEAGSCRTLASILPVFDQSPLWQNSLWSSDHACCGVSRGSPPSPPPSPNPPSPAPPSPKPPFSLYKENGWIVAGTAEYEDITCHGSYITVCGQTINDEVGAQMAQSLTDLATAVVFNVFGIPEDGTCPVVLAGLTVGMAPSTGYEKSPCVPAPIPVSGCAPPPPQWPEYPCRTAKTNGINYNNDFPFRTSNQYILTSTSSSSSEYCVEVSAPGPFYNSKCGNKTTLKKLQFFLDYNRRYQIKAITLKYNNGQTATRSQSWGPVGSNSLKVTDLNWTIDDVNRLQPKVCFTIKAGTTLTDLALNEQAKGPIWSAAFSEDLDCCPTLLGSTFLPDGEPIEIPPA